MAKTSDFCPRCQSVQVGLRRPDGRFVCLNCSTKEEVVEAAAMPVRHSPPQDLSHNRSLGMVSLGLGLTMAILAAPITIHYRDSGDASTALLLVLPAGVVPLFIGLLANRSRWGQAGAVSSLLACMQVLFMVLFFEAKKAEQADADKASNEPTPQVVRRALVYGTDRLPGSAPRTKLAVRRTDPPVDDGVLSALRAKAEEERKRTADIQRLQEMLGQYYASVRSIEQFQSQRALLDANRVRLQAQIADYEARIRKAEAEAKAEAAKRDSPAGGVKVTVTGYDAASVKSAEANRLTQERNALQAQLSDANAQMQQLDQSIAGEQGRAGVLGRAVKEHCTRMGEPVPELRFLADEAPATPAEPANGSVAQSTGAKTDTPIAPPPVVPHIRIYVLRDGRTLRTVSVEQRGNTIEVRDESGQKHDFLDSDVQEVMLVPATSAIKQIAVVKPPVQDAPKPVDEVKSGGAKEPAVSRPAGVKRFLLRDGQAIKAYRVIELADEYALQDEEGEVHKVKKNQVREILPAP